MQATHSPEGARLHFPEEQRHESGRQRPAPKGRYFTSQGSNVMSRAGNAQPRRGAISLTRCVTHGVGQANHSPEGAILHFPGEQQHESCRQRTAPKGRDLTYQVCNAWRKTAKLQPRRGAISLTRCVTPGGRQPSYSPEGARSHLPGV
jgi:hypothetical protein